MVPLDTVGGWGGLSLPDTVATSESMSNPLVISDVRSFILLKISIYTELVHVPSN